MNHSGTPDKDRFVAGYFNARRIVGMQLRWRGRRGRRCRHHAAADVSARAESVRCDEASPGVPDAILHDAQDQHEDQFWVRPAFSGLDEVGVKLMKRRDGIRLRAIWLVLLALQGCAHTLAAAPGPIGGSLWSAQGGAPVRNGSVSVPNGEVGGAVQTVLVHPTDPNILYVGTVNGGVWKTTNGISSSPSWTPLTDFAGSLSIGSLDLDPMDSTHNTLIAGSGSFSSLAVGGSWIGILKSIDGGTTWTHLDNGGAFGNILVSGVASRGNVIVATASQTSIGIPQSGGMYRSTNSGASFYQVSTPSGAPYGLPSGLIRWLAGDPFDNAVLYTALYPGYGGTNVGIYKSVDAGATWTKKSSPAMDALIAFGKGGDRISVGTNGIVCVASLDSSSLAHVFKSQDGGGSWIELDFPSTPDVAFVQGSGNIMSLLADPRFENIVYIGAGASGLRYDASQSAGRRWARLNATVTLNPPNGGTIDNTSPHTDWRNMAMGLNGDLLSVSDGGIFRRSNPLGNLGGWISLNGNLNVIEAHNIAFDSLFSVLNVGTQDNGTHRQTGAGELVWNTIFGSDGGDVAVDTISTPGVSIVYASDQYFTPSLTRFTYNSALTVVSNVHPLLAVQGGGAPVQGQFITPIRLNSINPRQLIIAAGNSIYESFDQGDTVYEIGPGIKGYGPSCLAYGGMLNGQANPGVVYVAAGSGVYVRTNAVGILAATPSPFPDGKAQDITIVSTNWMSVFAISTKNVFLSTNAGGSWSNITGNLTGVGRLWSVCSGPSNLPPSVIVGTDIGVYVSMIPNLGFWNRVGANLPTVLSLDLEYNQAADVLAVATTGRGAWLITNATSRMFSPSQPFITTQPQPQSIPVGASALFAPVIAGTPPFNYQWRKNGTLLTGATNAVLAVPVAQLSDIGTFEIVVSNALGSATSMGATLTVTNVSTPTNSVPAPTGLISWWPGDNTANDRAGTNHGVLQYGGGYSAGLSAQAFVLNGYNEFVSVPDSPAWAFSTNAFSIDLWANFTATSGDMAFMANDEGGGQTRKWIFWRQGGRLGFTYGDTTGGAAFSSAPFAPIAGQWYHVAVTRSGSNFSFFVNGVQTGTATSSFAFSDANAALTIGQAENSFFFNGLLDDVRIYSRALSAAEIQNIYVAGTNGMAPPARPSITTQPFGQTLLAGATATFSAQVAGSTPLIFQWMRDGVPLPGATNASYSMSSAQLGDTGIYSLIVSNALGSATSSSAVLVVSPAPVRPAIVAQPASQGALVGTTVTLSVTVTGTGPLYYQWRTNGVLLADATNSILTLINVQTNQSANYSVVVSNIVGTAISSDALLAVTVPIVPGITMQPIDQTTYVGATATLRVVASGSAPLGYQWRFNGNNIGGATNAIYTLANVQTGNAGSYTVVVANIAGGVTSSNAVLTVLPAPVGPLIFTQPLSQQAYVGADVSFVTVASGTAPLTYLWRFNNANIPGGNTATLHLGSVTANQAGEYFAIVSNSEGLVFTDKVRLNVDPSPFVLESPQSVDVAVNGTPTLFVRMLGEPPFTYQWRWNGTNLLGATSTNYTLANIQIGQAGGYDVVVTNSFGSVTSAVAVVRVAGPLAITVPLRPQTVPVGATLTLTVEARGLGLNYYWFFKGQQILGASNASLIIPNAQLTSEGAYLAVVADVTGLAVTSDATVTVDPMPLLTQQPANRSILFGNPATFAVSVLGQPPFGYQWRRNSVDLVGETNASFGIAAVGATNAGIYSVRVFNNYGALISSNATLSVAGPPLMLLRSGGQTALTIPAFSSQFVLEFTDGFGPGHAWTPVTFPTGVPGSDVTIQVELTSGARIYRLRSP